MEMLEPDEFLAEAQSLGVGEKRKVRHLCGDASLVVYNNVDSWSAWCWRCRMRGWVPKPEANMAERLERQRQQRLIDERLQQSAANLPQPECHDFGAWPVACRVWIWKAGLTDGMVKALGAYYHAPSDRVVLPVKDEHGRTLFWQARNCQYPADGRPKYISCTVPRDRVHVCFPRQIEAGDARPVVLVEDILSAFKVGASGAGLGYAVMGTELGSHSLAWLARQPTKSVAVWTDDDPAGQASRVDIAKRLDYIGREVHHITSSRDPKALSLREIGEHIRERHRPQHATDLQEP